MNLIKKIYTDGANKDSEGNVHVSEVMPRNEDAASCQSHRKHPLEHDIVQNKKYTKKQLMDNNIHNSIKPLYELGSFPVESSECLSTDNEKESSGWKETCEGILNNQESLPIHRENLNAFLVGSNELQDAQESIKSTFDEINLLMEKTLENSLASIYPVHNFVFQSMSKTESNIVALLQYNHKLRKDSLRLIDDYNKMWRSKYESYMVQIASSQKGQNSDLRGDKDIKKFIPPLQTLGSTEDSSVPNWNEMMKLNPLSKVRIDAFLEGSSQWNAACDELENAFDDVRRAIETSHDNVLQVIEAVYSRINGEQEEFQEGLRFAIMANFQRRTHIENEIQEVVNRQSSIISSFKSRLGGNQVTETMKHNASDQSKQRNLKSLMSFATIFPLSR